jgi:hypothetical protein
MQLKTRARSRPLSHHQEGPGDAGVANVDSRASLSYVLYHTFSTIHARV